MSARERRAKQRKHGRRGRGHLAAPAALVSTVVIGLAGPGAAQANPYTATQLKNVNTAAAGSFPTEPTAVGATLYYSADTAATGRELWSTHGPGTGANLVDDIVAGTGSSNPEHLTNADGTLFFLAQNAAGTEELWTSNGTAAGTVPLTTVGDDLYSLPTLVNLGSTVYFLQTEAGGSTQLWSSNGTVGGTTHVNLPNVSDGRYLTGAGGEQLYFVAPGIPGTNYADDQELWSYNTSGEILQVSTFEANGQTASPFLSDLVNVGGTVYFTAAGTDATQVWKTTGGAPGVPGVSQVTTLANGLSVQSLTAAGSDVYFLTQNAADVQELWVTTGTGESALTNISNQLYSEAGDLTAVGSALFFLDTTASGTPELWKTNGVAAGTLPVPNSPNDVGQLINADGTLYFSDANGTGGLWGSNGNGVTEITTTLSNTGYFGNDGATVFFSAENATSQSHLWSISATNAVAEVDAGVGASDNAGSYPSDFTNVANHVFFDATSNGLESLWFSDGSPGGSVPLSAANGASIGPAFYAVNVGGTLYFVADTGANGDTALWSSNGTSASTAPVALGNAAEYPAGGLANVNGELYYIADGANAATSAYGQLWETNGASAEAVQLTAFTNAAVQPVSDQTVVNAGSEAFFDVQTPNGVELWASNGASAGTARVTNTTTASQQNFIEILDPTAAGGELYFATESMTSEDLWVTNGTPSGTVELGPVQTNGYSPYLTDVDGTVYFRDDDELYATNGTAAGTRQVDSDIDPYSLINVAGTFYFAGSNASTRIESLWTSNGTAAGTHVIDTPGSANDDGLGYLANANGVLAFVANDGTHGTELWTSNGTSAGTSLVSDIWPGAGSGLESTSGGYYSTNPELTAAGSNLFFAADDSVDGLEPYVASSFGAGGGSGTGTSTTTTPTTTTPTKTTPTPPIHPPHPILGGSSGSGHTIELKLTCPTGDATCVVRGTLEIVETFRRGKLTAISAEARAGKRKRTTKTVRKTIKLSTGTLTLGAGHSGTLKLTLDGAGVRLLGKRHKLTTELLVTDGTDTVVKRSVTFTAPVVKQKKTKK